MKILVPLNNADHLQEYVQAGAEEYYIGFYDPRWFETFGEYADINRMSAFREFANRYDFREMLKIIERIKQYGKFGFVTMNANIYSADQVEYAARNYFPAMKAAGVDGVIVSDVNMAKAAMACGLDTVASTMCAVYNSDIARILASMGIRRQILPRDLSLKEIEEIVEKTPGIDYEIFFMRNGCVFSDSYCLGMHRLDCGSTCGFLRSNPREIFSDQAGFRARHDIEFNDYIYSSSFHRDACGMCALYRFMKMGIGSLKIVGRADRPDSVLRDIRLTVKNMEIAEWCACEEEFLEKMHFSDENTSRCFQGLSCYYPEVRF